MQIKDFAVEQWMNEWETKCTHNVAETCVYSLTLDQLFDAACAVEQAVFGMDVEMNEVSPLTVPFGHIAHAPSSSVSVCSSSR